MRNTSIPNRQKRINVAKCFCIKIVFNTFSIDCGEVIFSIVKHKAPAITVEAYFVLESLLILPIPAAPSGYGFRQERILCLLLMWLRMLHG